MAILVLIFAGRIDPIAVLVDPVITLRAGIFDDPRVTTGAISKGGASLDIIVATPSDIAIGESVGVHITTGGERDHVHPQDLMGLESYVPHEPRQHRAIITEPADGHEHLLIEIEGRSVVLNRHDLRSLYWVESGLDLKIAILGNLWETDPLVSELLHEENPNAVERITSGWWIGGDLQHEGLRLDLRRAAAPGAR